jgi:AcrR family transcriptional regulator
VKARKQAKSRSSKPKSGAATSGLRARKREQTRERLTRAAMALFLERGFEATTLDDIAAAADISRRSFFHYFASKEDVVFTWQEELSAALVAAVGARPAGESMLTAAENAIAAMVRQVDASEAIAMSCLKRDNPALRARDQVKYEKLERALAEALGKRADAKENAKANVKAERVQARLVAMIATGAMRIGEEIWTSEGAREKPEALVQGIFAAVRAIFD